MKTLILGIGSPLLGDDGAGYHVARRLSQDIREEGIAFEYGCIGGLNLLQLIAGYKKVIIIDAIMTSATDAGKVLRREVRTSDEEHDWRGFNSHQASLEAVLKVGRICVPEQMPGKIVLYAIGVPEVTGVTMELTDKVEKAIPEVVELIKREVGKPLYSTV